MSDLGLYDFKLQGIEDGLWEEVEVFFQFSLNYQLETGAQIRPGQTMTYGYWTVKFEAAEDNTLEVWEFEPDITSGRLVIGANYALRCWRVQRGLCKALNVPFNPPHASHMGYVSAGVLDGTFPLEGGRYPSMTPTLVYHHGSLQW